MNKYLFNFVIYLIILIYYLIFDFIMISLVTKNVFSKMIKNIQKSNMIVKPIPTFVSFIVLALGLYLFIYDRIRDDNILMDSLKWALPYGLIVYAIYDLTNLATITNWKVSVSIFDICWGGILSFIVILLSKLTIKKIKNKK